MTAMWCKECGRYVDWMMPCPHLSSDTYTKVPVIAHGGDDAVGPGDAERPARSGDDLLEDAARTPTMSAEEAEVLTKSGDELIKGGRNRGQDALIEALFDTLSKLVQQFQLTTVDLLGSLDLVKANVLKHVERQARGDDD